MPEVESLDEMENRDLAAIMETTEYLPSDMEEEPGMTELVTHVFRDNVMVEVHDEQ